MTGFGSGEAAVGPSRISVEVRSVNHRFFTPSIKLPSSMAKLETEIREAMRQKVSRGHVTLSLRVSSDAEGGARIDEARVAAYAAQLTAIQERLRLPGTIGLDAVLRLPQVITTEELEAPTDKAEDILPVIRKALEEFDAMRAVEGAKLAAVILDRLAAIEGAISRVAERAPARVIEQRDRLKKAVMSLMEGALPDESRIAQEIAILADRLDVAEELARFSSHISAFRVTLEQPPADGVGKRLGFLLQELLREANTTGSKANDSAIVAEVLTIKEDIERIREQVENLE
jgi:uncharacterized protein (TIGR00255 family)